MSAPAHAHQVPGGWLVFAHTPDAASLLGRALMAACGAAGAWLTLRENHSLRAALRAGSDT